jgi:hypothetical protein
MGKEGHAVGRGRLIVSADIPGVIGGEKGGFSIEEGGVFYI